MDFAGTDLSSRLEKENKDFVQILLYIYVWQILFLCGRVAFRLS